MWKKKIKDQRLDQEEETNIIPFKNPQRTGKRNSKWIVYSANQVLQTNP